MPIYRLNSSFSWKKLANIYRLNSSFSWKKLSAAYRLNSSFSWKRIFSSEVGPEISNAVTLDKTTNSTTGLVKLTGTNYNWINANSLTYFFEWYNNNEWQTIDSGSITNPPVGSPNTKEYIVQGIDTRPNDDNLYRFRVRATNINLQSNSTSNIETISTPRNITNITASQVGTTLQATVSFTVGMYTNSVVITRYKYSSGTLQSTTTYNRTTSSPATIPIDEYDKEYRFSVTPYTGSLVSGNVTGYPGNQSGLTNAFISSFPPVPVQTSKPFLSTTGNISIGTTITASRGAYTPETILEGNPDIAIQTRVYGWKFPGPSLTNGTTTVPSPDTTSATSQSLTTTQTMVNYVFYAVDIVQSADGLSTYYFYSDLSASAFMPSFSDNFDRANTTGSQGLGQTSTGSRFWSTNNNLYGYQNPTTNTDNVSWQINLNTAYNNNSVAFGAAPTSYHMKTINVGDSNVSLAVSIPNGGGGPGLAFWVTASGSWWAVAPSYYQQIVVATTYPCTDGPYSHTSKTCPATSPGSTTVGDICSCTEGFDTATTACNDGPYTHTSTTCPQTFPSSTTIGQVCSCTSGSTTTNCNGTRNHYDSLTDAQLSCGSCGITQTANYYQTCPTPTTSSTKYSDNTLGTGCNQKCSCIGPYTDPGTSTCGTTYSGSFQGLQPQFSCVTAADVGKVCAQRPLAFGFVEVARCVLGTAASTYYHCSTRSCSDSWSCTYQSVTTNASYYKVGSATVTTNASYYKVKSETTTTTTYYSRLRILSASGSSVISEKEQILASSTSQYQPIRSLDVSTSNNTITAKGYSDTARVIQLGNTVTHTATNPLKSVAGDSAVGIINTPTDANRTTGNRLDDFIYTNV